MATEIASLQDQQIRELARSIDCLTEEEFALLADVKLSTVEAWRKRGQGPEYARFGSRFLYPRAAVATYVAAMVRRRAHRPEAAALL